MIEKLTETVEENPQIVEQVKNALEEMVKNNPTISIVDNENNTRLTLSLTLLFQSPRIIILRAYDENNLEIIHYDMGIKNNDLVINQKGYQVHEISAIQKEIDKYKSKGFITKIFELLFQNLENTGMNYIKGDVRRSNTRSIQARKNAIHPEYKEPIISSRIQNPNYPGMGEPESWYVADLNQFKNKGNL